MSAKVYVVVALYNGSMWIEKCFGSLRSSTIEHDVIVVDNASSDDGADKIECLFPEVTVIRRSDNAGFGRANNIGIKHAYEKGAEFVFLLNQDAWVESDTIEKLIVASQTHQKFGVLSPIHLSGDGRSLDYNFSSYVTPDKCKRLYSDRWCGVVSNVPYKVKFVNAAAWLITRRCLDKVGGFSPAFFLYGEDINYCHRLDYHGLNVGVCAQATIFHDRKNRPVRDYFANEKLNLERQILVAITDPNGDGPTTVKKNSLKKIINGLIFFTRHLVLQGLNEYRIASREWKRVRSYVDRSRGGKGAFFDD